jgi:hypothetical protein
VVAPNSVFGYIDFDTDKDATTGVDSFIDMLAFLGVPGPPAALGVEFYVDLFSEVLHPGLVDVWDAGGNLVATTAITYGPASLSFELLPAWLGGATDFNYGILVGDVSGPTDRSPNGDVPEPAMLSMMAAGVAAFAAARRLSARSAR